MTTTCEDCPPVAYPTDKTRCLPCPRRKAAPSGKTNADAIMEGRIGDMEAFDRINYLRSLSDGYDYRGGP